MFTDIPEVLADDPWFNPCMLSETHWAVVVERDASILAVFYDDTRSVFDEIVFGSVEEAEIALLRNGFSKYMKKPGVHKFIGLPTGEFHESVRKEGSMYSEGDYWLSVEIPESVACDPWIKVVGFLQVHWAVLIDQADSVLVVFYWGSCEVFDEMVFKTREEAEAGLRRNKFCKYLEEPRYQEHIGLPQGKFRKASQHSHGSYSSGESWV